MGAGCEDGTSFVVQGGLLGLQAAELVDAVHGARWSPGAPPQQSSEQEQAEGTLRVAMAPVQLLEFAACEGVCAAKPVTDERGC
jgi:hypothetical protein